MELEKHIEYFHSRYKSIFRPDREKVLCAMIRINYGTPWNGDDELLRAFFPLEFHSRLVLGGLTELIEALSPFSDEPTDPGFSNQPKPTFRETVEATMKETTEMIKNHIDEPTSKISEETVTLYT